MTDKPTYGQIIKSSSIMGGAAGINMLISMVRVKFAAVLIGLGGVGLLANFMAIQGMVGTIAGFGLQSSAVREIVTSASKDDQQAVGRTVLSLRRMCWLTGFLGMFAMMAISPLLSKWTFGTGDYTLHIAFLGPIILFGNVSGGQMAILQGMRRIGDLARVNIISAAIGTAISIAFYAWLGLQGIVPAIVLIAAVQLMTSWHFSHRILVPETEMSWAESFRAAGGMMQLGIVFMWQGLLMSIVAYVTNSMITQQISIEAVGVYSAAFAISAMFVTFVLNAMTTDYYPRLTELIHDKGAMKRLVNEQTEIGLLLAVPGLVVTMSFAPWIIRLFYTSEFLPAVDLIHWLLLGCFGSVISVPIGYVMLSLGKGNIYFIVVTLMRIIHMFLISVGLFTFGIEGVAIAYFLFFVIHLIVVTMVARLLIQFSWSAECRHLLFVFTPIIAITFFFVKIFPLWPSTLFGILLTFGVSIFSLRGLAKAAGNEHPIIRKILRIPGMRILI